jgi:hypothetical protein
MRQVPGAIVSLLDTKKGRDALIWALAHAAEIDGGMRV